jgi:hypothetical protein
MAIVEWVPPDDPMARRLIAARPEGAPRYTREAFNEGFDRFFEIAAEESIPESGRSLLLMARRDT